MRRDIEHPHCNYYCFADGELFYIDYNVIRPVFDLPLMTTMVANENTEVQETAQAETDEGSVLSPSKEEKTIGHTKQLHV